MKRTHHFITLTAALLTLTGGAAAQTLPGVSLDPVLNWKEPHKLTLDTLKKAYENVKDAAGETACREVTSTSPYAPPVFYSFSAQKRGKEPMMLLSALGGRLALTEAIFVFNPASGTMQTIEMYLEPGFNGSKISQARTDLAKFLGPPSSPAVTRRNKDGSSSTSQSWMQPAFLISLSTSARGSEVTGTLRILVLPGKPQPVAGAGTIPPPAASPASPASSGLTDLDVLWKFEEVWKWTPDDLAKAFATAGPQTSRLEWLTPERDRARLLGRILHGPAPQASGGRTASKWSLAMAGGEIWVADAGLEFTGGRLARMTFTLYGGENSMFHQVNNRLSPYQHFMQIVKKVEERLKNTVHVTPFGRRLEDDPTGSGVAEVWASPLVHARLEHTGFIEDKFSREPMPPRKLELKLISPEFPETKTGLDKYVTWAAPLAVLPSTLEKISADLVEAGHEQAVVNTAGEGGTGRTLELHPVYSVVAGGKLTAFDDRFSVHLCRAGFRGDTATDLTLGLRWLGPEDQSDTRKELIRILTEWYGSDPTSDGMVTLGNGPAAERVTWNLPDSKVSLYRNAADPRIVLLSAVAPGVPLVTTLVPNLPGTDASLDSLLDFTGLWRLTPDDFEKTYRARPQAPKTSSTPPQFEWLSSNRDRARFSRRMIPEVDTHLKMFGGTVRAEEAVVEFVNGRAARATISFYNRGDSGDIPQEEFEATFKQVGRSLGQATKVAPRSQLMSSNAAVKTTGWIWTTPQGLAILEHNDFKSAGADARPEFLRLKLAAPDQADWSMGKLAVGVQRMALVKNVKNGADGDTYITGVPMVDQGAKGYCVAASCQRLFEYMQIPCDQHEMAQLLEMDSTRGVNVINMHKSLARVDGKFSVTFKPFVNPGLYEEKIRAREVSLNEFKSIVKEHADKGVPLLWALGLGQFPEDPPLPNGGQVSGGHMRMIIGYNAAKGQILFTDSWGAGHELKRMAAGDAHRATLGLYSMSPRGM